MPTMEQLAHALTAKSIVEDLLAALKFADEAINPPDLGGISLDKWHTRLKSATAEIRVAITKGEAFLKNGAS